MEKIEGYHQKFEEPDLSGSYTAKDYLTWKMAEYVELIRGKIYKMSPAPARQHQYVAGRLTGIMVNYIHQACDVYPAPFDVYLVHPEEDWKSTRNIVEPDLCVICDKSKLHERGCTGAPDLVAEILSPGSAGKDLGPKRDLYEEYGVRELWIVHPQDRTLVMHVLENGKFRLLPMLSAEHKLRSVIFPELEFDLKKIFPENDREI